jgi:Zn-dependent M28 family amino/carboxypeptidase
VAAEDYNRMVRMIRQGLKLKMAVDLQVQFYPDDLMAYNTVAEIPGTDLRKEIVMLGAHLDSWHAGTGATDNAVGVAAVMEAARILKALNLQPRRTIRLGLWSGEEQGLLGSKAYVARHFGYYTNAAPTLPLRAPKEQTDGQPVATVSSTNSPPARRLVRQGDYDKLTAYFNLDNGAGRIRGVYMQGNGAVRPLFRRWLEPFRDLDAETLTDANTMGTDHLSFDAIGLPGFQFIQDPLDYGSRTHHTNEDVLDRIQPEDLKQASVILAAFAYDAANLDEKLPRKPTE